MTSSTSRFALSLLSAALVLGLSACGNKDGKNVATQVVAKVGSEEISVHQINQVLSRTFTEGTAPDAAQAMSRVVLEKLINQQIAVDQAIENKLHRTPEVLSQIEAARREILTRAYMQKIASALPKPSAEDAKTYFAEHPQLFSERRIFNVQEIVAPVAAGTAEQLRRFLINPAIK
jgi:EpsD family peptidyl-prolyl cis-trans isomerase